VVVCGPVVKATLARTATITAKKAAVVTISRVDSSIWTSFQNTRADARAKPGGPAGLGRGGREPEDGDEELADKGNETENGESVRSAGETAIVRDHILTPIATPVDSQEGAPFAIQTREPSPRTPDT
jgi:hypothetical protein